MIRILRLLPLAFALSLAGCEEEPADMDFSYEMDESVLERDTLTSNPGTDSWCECCDSRWDNCYEASCSSTCKYKQECEKAADGRTNVCEVCNSSNPC